MNLIYYSKSSRLLQTTVQDTRLRDEEDMSDEVDEKVEVVVVAGHGGLRVDSLTGQRKGGAPLNSERLAKMPLPSGQSTITTAFKKQKTDAAC